MPEPLKNTRAGRLALVRGVRCYADLMGLRDWQFVMSDESDDSPDEDDPDAIMQTKIWDNSRTATLLVRERFWENGALVQRETVTHELVHWHTEYLYQQARDFARAFSREAFEVAVHSLDRVHERAVDSISAAWATSLPFLGSAHCESACAGYDADGQLHGRWIARLSDDTKEEG